MSNQKGDGFMDDANDKIRRNLLAISVLVIVLWWIDVKELELLKRALGDVGKDVALWKVRLGALILLIYFLLRYRFSENFTKFYIEKRKDLGHLTKTYSNKFLDDALGKYVVKGKSQSVFSNPKDEVKNYLASIREVHKDSIFKITNHTLNPSYTKGDWEGVINFGLAASYGSTYGEQTTRQQEISFEIKGFNKWMICVKCWIILLAYSKTSIEYLLPMLLGVMAIGIILYRMIFF